MSKRVVITGATRGLGRAMADGFVELGWTVAGCGRTPEAIEALCKAHADPHYWAVADLAEEASREAFAGGVLDHMGPPDLLLNNGALINENAPLWEISDDAFASLMAVNVNGVAGMIRRFVPAMIERGEGIVINFSSGWGRSTSPDVAPYCASKWAIEGLSQALAQELPSGLATAAMNPGILHTEMLQSCFGSAAGAYPDATAWARKAVPFLASLDVSCNGQALTAPA